MGEFVCLTGKLHTLTDMIHILNRIVNDPGGALVHNSFALAVHESFGS